ncbi:ssDNA-binding transcriptional regulator [Chloropicon primus]|nr:ssDNA-binding transcriptional regulator [Chloropicon primus]|mmetsp:Transcript_5082/g.15252  ORF Transcript_5082/g.15252 Transcript_5082/m.15252 type:complete len:434 (-) Transcript_5082:1086-2387(-)
MVEGVIVPTDVILSKASELLREYDTTTTTKTTTGRSDDDDDDDVRQQVKEEIVEDLKAEYGRASVDSASMAVKEAIDQHFATIAAGRPRPSAPTRKRDDGEEHGGHVKRARAEGKEAGEAEALQLELASGLFVTTQFYGGKKLLSLRKHFQKDDKWLPTKKGVSLATDQWSVLCSKVSEVSNALAAKDTGFACDLGGGGKRVTISDYKGKDYVDVRQWYQKAGESAWQPTSKGVSLSKDAWGKLVDHLEPITQNMEGGGGATPALKPAAAPVAKAGVAAPAPAEAPARASAGPTATPGEVEVALSSTRYLKVRENKNSKLADFREFYQKNGALHPGKKGIALAKAQWSVLYANLSQIDAALKERNTAYDLELSSGRRVRISDFRGKHYVDIREWWQKAGEAKWLPGKKGISLNPDQWAMAMGNAGQVDAAMGN